MFSTFTELEHDGDNKKIRSDVKKFELHCEPRKNFPFERYQLNRRCQEPGESYDHAIPHRASEAGRKLRLWVHNPQ